MTLGKLLKLSDLSLLICKMGVIKVPTGFEGGSVVKNLPASAGDGGSVPGLGRSPAGGNGNPFQYSCLGNPMARGAWQATVQGVAEESDTTLHLNNNKNNKSTYERSK